ncbi:hypothetical protein G9A89_022540 [Geosiphon pyriformis]|nr:hypothetical protein G9A89_022540 [Geosiphon pyriformis]
MATFKALLLLGSYKKPMPILSKKSLDRYQQILEKITPLLLSGLRTDLSYALWPLLVLKDNSTIDMAIKLAQRIENNQRIHLGSTLPVFASAPAMVPALQIAAISFATHTQDPNEQLIDRLTANLAQLLKPLA